jgi:hypothetical protein
MGNGLGSTLDALEEKRQQMMNGNTKIMLWIFGFALLPMGWFLLHHTHWVAYAIVAFIAVLICAVWINSRKKNLAIEFKQEAINHLLDAVLPSIRYSAMGYVHESEFNASNLYKQPDRYNGKDYFEGYADKTAVSFSLVHAEERYETTHTDTDKDGHTTTTTREHWRDIFKGLFFAADFNKNFQGRTLVRAGKAGILSGLFGNIVKLEDPRFNKLFHVSSSDQVEARYILTPSLMERLIGLRDSLSGFEVSFNGSWVYIASSDFPWGAFEPDLRKPCNDTRQVERMLGWILQVVGIVEELDLNTRIWTK